MDGIAGTPRGCSRGRLDPCRKPRVPAVLELWRWYVSTRSTEAQRPHRILHSWNGMAARTQNLQSAGFIHKTNDPSWGGFQRAGRVRYPPDPPGRSLLASRLAPLFERPGERLPQRGDA